MIRWRWFWFSISVVMFALSFPASQRLNLDRTLHRMFDAKDPARLDFELLQEKFGVSDLVVFAYRDPDFWKSDGSGLDRLSDIRRQVESVDGIAMAMDLSKVDEMLGQLGAPLSVFNALASKPTHPMLDAKNVLAMRFKTLFEGQTHSADGDLVAIACMLDASGKASDDDGKRVSNSTAIAGLRKLGNSLPTHFNVSAAMLVGQPVMVEEGFDEIEKDGVRLAYFSTIGLSLLILVGFRSLRWALLTIAVVQWSLVVTRGMLVWIAWDLTMVSSMLSSIVTVIGVATTMHWMLGYRKAMEDGATPELALRRSMADLWRPIMWACITDAIGFISLAFANVGPVQDYGCMMALASLVVLLGIFLLVPTLALVPLVPTSISAWLGMSFKLQSVPGDSTLQSCLGWIKSLAIRHPFSVVIGSLILAVVAVWGSLRLQVETDFIQNFRQDAPLVVAYQAVENELGGAGVWDIVLPAPKVITQPYLDQVLSLEKRLMAIEVSGAQPLRLTKVMSFADADEASRQSELLGRLPVEARLLGMRQAMGDFVDTLITPSDGKERYMRIMLRSREQSETVQKEALISQVRKVVEETVRSEVWSSTMGSTADAANASVSGYYVLLSRLVSSVVADQWRCFAIASFGIWIAMSIALRSPWMAIMTILPNALPSLCILGWMGWVGMRVNLGAAMIAAVSMGLSVDSSLHYLMRFQREIRNGKSFSDAIEAAQSEIGMAMALSTAALVIGFGSLAMSDFLPTVVFGTTAAISMVGGLIGNLVILPALLVLSTRKAAAAG